MNAQNLQNAVRYMVPKGTPVVRCLACGENIHPVRQRDGSVINVEAAGDLRGQKHTLCGRARRVGT